MPGFSDIASASSTPIIEGQTVTFFWEGEGIPALIGDFNGWEPSQLTRAGEIAWTYEI